MPKDYTRYSFYITLLVIGLMTCLSFIPPSVIGGVRLKRTNIFSSLFQFTDELSSDRDAELTKDDLAFINEAENLIIPEETAEGMPADGAAEPAGEEWQIGGGAESAPPNSGDRESNPANFDNVTGFEDFSPEDSDLLGRFHSLLENSTANRTVRIAFLGDSYIEGDIITADVREQLQGAYGGRGIGFVPFSSPLAQNKPTVKHTFGGWKNYNLIQKKSAPDDVKDRFFVSGTVSVPDEGAWSEYEMTSFRKHISTVSQVRLLFTNEGSTEILMTVNDSIHRTFRPEPSEQVQQIVVSGAGIKKVKVQLTEVEGFYGYGLELESPRGVTVDNYSIRSNSGLALFGTSSAVNTRMNRLLGYDMVVLQYGLNIMEAEVTSYRNYGEQLRNLINYIKGCFPGSVVVVMGVGDRSTLDGGEFKTMPAVSGLVAEQRRAAEDCGVVFWNTYEAMGGYNSMTRFVEWGWAAKDYTHLSFAGGRKIATEFVKAINFAGQGAVNEYTDQPEAMRQQPVSLGSFNTGDETDDEPTGGVPYESGEVPDSTAGEEITETVEIIDISEETEGLETISESEHAEETVTVEETEQSGNENTDNTE